MKRRDYRNSVLWGNVPRQHSKMLIRCIRLAAEKHAVGNPLIRVEDNGFIGHIVIFHADKMRVTRDAFTAEVNALYKAKISAQRKRKESARTK